MLARCYLATAAAGVLLASGVAHAQATNPPHVDMPIGAELGAVQPADNDGATLADTAMPDLVSQAPPTQLEKYGVNAQTAASADVSARVPPNSSASNQAVVTSAPVYDTPQNRRLYRPLSQAGRMTKPAGN